MKKSAIVPGSFDPVTSGHIEVIRAASAIFDQVFVVILNNAEKKSGFFTPDERLKILKAALSDMKKSGMTNISAILYDSLTSDAAHDLNAGFIVKGVRSQLDFQYEFELSEIMRRFDSSLQTIWIPSSPENVCISSTYIRELIKYGLFDNNAFASGTSEVIREICIKK